MERFKKLLPILGLGVVDLLIFLTNFIHGTFLMGWDNLMPEFDIPLNIQRSIFAIWQGYRGLGNLDGLGNVATITHTIMIWILSLIFSLNTIRYVFIIGTHFVGGVGLYFLAKKLTNNKIASFLAALFYMLNLGVVQMYYAPLEAFAVHFASLPWIALFAMNALKDRRRRNLLALFFAGIIFSSQGFIPTIFAVLLIFLVTLHASFAFKTGQFKYSIMVFLVFLASNAFWLVPYTYSAIKTPAAIESSRINQFATEEIFFRNKAHGNLADVLRFKGFMINSSELNTRSGTSGFLIIQWKTFSETPIYNLVYLILFLIFIFGLFQIIRRKNYELIPFVASFGIAFFFLANDTFLLSNLNDLVRLFPFVGEAFRFPFTKFITLFAFCFSIILAFGISTISITRQEFKKAFYIIIFVAIIFLGNPALRGDFFSPLLRIPLPKDYLSFFKTMQGLDPNQRLALFPVYSFWDWEYLEWGDIGSGFQWFGVPQAMTKRAFDPWSAQNEQFYNEISYQVNNQNTLGLMNVIKKYDVKYILLDQNIMNTLIRQPINYDSLKSFLAKQSYISVKNTFGKLILYQVNLPESFVSQVSNKQTFGVDPNYNFEKNDSTFQTVGTYVKSLNNPDVVPLFPSLFSEKLQTDLEYSVSEKDKTITLTSKKTFPKISDGYTLEVPSYPQEEYLVPVSIAVKDGTLEFTPIYPKVFINEHEYTMTDVPIRIPLRIVKNPTSVQFVDTQNNVDLTTSDPKAYLLTSFPNSLIVSDGKIQEGITFDTTFTNRSTFYIPAPNEEIKSVRVVIQKFPASISYPNALKTSDYKVTNPDAYLNSNDSQMKVTKSQDGVDMKAVGATAELAFFLDNLPHQASYFTHIDAHYISGLPTDFYTDNPFEFKAEVETKLSKKEDQNYVILPASEDYYKGYGFHFTVKSLGDEKAESILKSVEVAPFPSNLIRGLRLVKSSDEPIVNKFNEKTGINFQQINLSEYEATNINGNSYLILSQSFDSGWAAYAISKPGTFSTALPFIFGKKLSDHVLINNWENGWQINDAVKSPNSVVLVYLPQYFSYLGYLIFGVTFLILLYEVWVDKKTQD